MRFFALFLLFIGGCGGRQEMRCFECGPDQQRLAEAEEPEYKANTPTEESTPSPPDLLTLHDREIDAIAPHSRRYNLGPIGTLLERV